MVQMHDLDLHLSDSSIVQFKMSLDKSLAFALTETQPKRIMKEQILKVVFVIIFYFKRVLK